MPSQTTSPTTGTEAPARYTTDFRQRLVETPDCCITEYKVSPGQQSPWHSHTATSDLFYVLKGRLDIWLAEPTEVVELHAGQSYQVACGRVHKFTAAQMGGAHYLLIQGVGKPDFMVADIQD